jgi:hypothetical protein
MTAGVGVPASRNGRPPEHAADIKGMPPVSNVKTRKSWPPARPVAVVLMAVAAVAATANRTRAKVSLDRLQSASRAGLPEGKGWSGLMGGLTSVGFYFESAKRAAGVWFEDKRKHQFGLAAAPAAARPLRAAEKRAPSPSARCCRLLILLLLAVPVCWFVGRVVLFWCQNIDASDSDLISLIWRRRQRRRQRAKIRRQEARERLAGGSGGGGERASERQLSI